MKVTYNLGQNPSEKKEVASQPLVPPTQEVSLTRVSLSTYNQRLRLLKGYLSGRYTAKHANLPPYVLLAIKRLMEASNEQFLVSQNLLAVLHKEVYSVLWKLHNWDSGLGYTETHDLIDTIERKTLEVMQHFSISFNYDREYLAKCLVDNDFYWKRKVDFLEWREFEAEFEFLIERVRSYGK